MGLSFATLVTNARTAESTLPRGLEMLRRTERAFARATGEIGVRNGFLTFFTDDAISPPDSTPVRLRLLARPAPIEPRPGLLEWEPLYGDISRSIDMGYLTGPSVYTDAEGKKHHGVYFSLWRRNGEGLWCVVLDAGASLPEAASEFASGAFRAAPAAAWADSLSAVAAANAQNDLRGVETAFIAAARADVRKAYAAHLAEHPRLHREGMSPITDRDAVLAYVASQPIMTSAHVIKVDTAAAADLGWTFGACEYRAGEKTVSAGFTRVWKRDAAGHWRIVADLLNPVE